ncbi:unnamed protein product [Mesocestoides corti]|uniref:Uncharacterized protein n=1 Tax=Mesocestoides corti TaxID=53468 RepID=A0A0R3UEL9_MESCO|nr:unnamed protein product [Mesocestoides corti]
MKGTTPRLNKPQDLKIRPLPISEKAKKLDPREVESESDDEEAEGDEVPKLVGLGEAPQEERGPPILTPILSDIPVHGQTPWIMRRFLNGAYIRISSQLWPGAHCVAWQGGFDNIYVGWGLKAVGSGFQPLLPRVQTAVCEDIKEIDDPSPLEEEKNKQEEEDDEGEDDDTEEGQPE